MCGRRRDQGVSEVGLVRERVRDDGRRQLGPPACNSRAGHRPELLRELRRLHVAHTVRKLHVGDFVWVAQETSPRDPGKGCGQAGRGQRQGVVGDGLS